MSRKNATFLKKSLVALALTGGVTIAGIASATVVEKTPCVANRVDTDGSKIALWCNGDANIYYVFNSGSCSPVNMDTFKMFLSQAQTALISGKPLDLFYVAPAGSCADRVVISAGVKL